MILEIQLRWIQQLQSVLRSTRMDMFFRGWDYVDSMYFSILVVALIWYLWDQKLGARLFYLLLMSLVLNKVLKTGFHQPRPCQVDPLVGIICGRSPGLPSDAAQTAAIL